MTTPEVTRRVPLGAEIALAFAAAVASFTVTSVALAGLESEVVALVLLAPAYVGAVLWLARSAGVTYAIPVAMAGILAYDWFYLPPKHPHEFPDSPNLVGLLVYFSVAVLVGQLAERTGRRAAALDRARGAIAGEQAALRRVATLVAHGTPATDLFAAVAEEVGRVLDVDGTRIARYEGDDEITLVAAWSTPGYDPGGFDRAKLEGSSISAEVLRTGRVARIDDYEDAPMPAPFATGIGVVCAVGAPIVVEGRLWGPMVVWSTRGPLPADTGTRLTDFTELVATAIANAETRAEMERLAEEQAALRRVATLVARGVPPREVFAAVAREVGLLLGGSATHMARYEPDGAVTGVGSWGAEGAHLPAGTRVTLDPESVTGLVFKHGRSARMDDYAGASGEIAALTRELGIRSSVGTPIVVDGEVWGVMIASSSEQPLPASAEARIAAFTELVATAVSNTEARTEIDRLTQEQAALRRVATLVARQSSPAEVFAAVAEEVGRVLDVEDTRMIRYESDGAVTVVASWGELDAALPVGMRMAVSGENVSAIVLRTGRPARKDRYEDASGPIGTRTRELGIRSAVGTPIVVEGRIWGAMIAASLTDEPLPPQTEARIGQFTELVATAISNIEARTALAASRARIVAATDDTRRRFERDLHDGIQQRLVLLSLEVRRTESMIPPQLEEPRVELTKVGQGMAEVLDDLRELSRGIHPAILSEGGLGPALKALARRSAVPIKLDVSVKKRLEERVEVAAYYVVSEALANAAKHARASVAEIHVEARNGTLDLTIRDDGVGGADPERGTGLTGLTDRVEALGGTLAIVSPAGAGTSLRVQLPVDAS